MELGLRGKVALVSASSKGLGRAIAEELAAEGASLVMCARGEETLRQTAESIRKNTGVKVVDIAADVSTQPGIDSVTKAALDKFGRVDILVTNSGGPPSGPFESYTPEMWEAAMRLLLMSAVGLARAALPGMKERRWGRILNVTSIAVKQPIDGLLLSNTVRAGLTGWAKTVSNEVAAEGVTVNNVAPGYTLTERQNELAEVRGKAAGKSKQEVIESWALQAPMRRMAQPEEIAAAVAFLASERASYITGVTLAVDGGWVKGLL